MSDIDYLALQANIHLRLAISRRYRVHPRTTGMVPLSHRHGNHNQANATLTGLRVRRLLPRAAVAINLTGCPLWDATGRPHQYG